MKNKLLLPCLLFIAASCNVPPKDVKMALNLAGENRKELEKVINHYRESGEKEKLRAAYFLIGNMINKFGMDGQEIRKYDPILNILDSLDAHYNISAYSSYIQGAWDSLVNLHGPPSLQKVEIFPDLNHITSGYLIEDIDLSFKLREESPWLKYVSFEQFCEFILPYRSGREPLEAWRAEYYYRYKVLRDSLMKDSCIAFANAITPHVPKVWAHGVLMKYPFPIPFSKMEVINRGACPHIVSFTASAFRANGLPVAIDYTPQWGNRSAEHSWNVLLLENGKAYPFDRSNKIIGIEFPYIIAKVYRKTFGRQDLHLSKNHDVPSSLIDYNHTDVTRSYTLAWDIRVRLNKPSQPGKRYAVICLFDNKRWVPVDFGKIKNKHAIFKNMGSGVMYLAMYNDEDNLTPASDQFIVGVDGNLTFIQLQDETQDMMLTRKYPMFERIRLFHSNMINGRFEGANRPDFSDSVNLFTITSIPEKHETAQVSYPEKVRYVRYISLPPVKGDVAELEFFGGESGYDTIKLDGTIIGFPEVTKTLGTPYGNAFDGNPETFFNRNTDGPAWAGIDLGSRKRITRIRYSPRSDTNFILVGDTYELCYWDNGEWVSMGEQVAKEGYLEYKDVPSGGLYLLHNLTRGKEERIFTYENGKQIWW